MKLQLNKSIHEYTTNVNLKQWIQEVVDLCEPDSVHLVDGNEIENELLLERLENTNTITKLNQKLRPNSYLARSNPDDVARVEDRTFICSEKKENAGPTNNWKDPKEMKNHLLTLFKGCMKGRIMYVVPYCMGPLNSPWAKVAVEITDSPYVVVNMRIMTRIGEEALEILEDNSFVKCLHSVGKPLGFEEKDVSWPCNPQNTYIVHFPEEHEVWSFGSGYGGNALLNKKCFALRLASVMAKKDGWLAEHMLIIGVTNPEGIKRYFAASFPSACGKTNLAMISSELPGWKVECVGDDIAWMHWGEDGKLYAINPEAGFFGVAPGTSYKINPHAMKTIERNTIFTNVAETKDGDVWWEGMTDTQPEELTSWTGEPFVPNSGKKAAHPNSRFTAPVSQCPIVDPQYNSLYGVPISGIIFGGRRSNTIPLVRQANSWEHGVFLGASMTSETTAAAKGEVGKVRNDPFAMLPFCGYNMGDYFGHWLKQHDSSKRRVLPDIFYVNWFLKDEKGSFIWPGFSENMRVIKWIFEREEGAISGVETPIGIIPELKDFDFSGLNLSSKQISDLFKIDSRLWKEEIQSLESYFSMFGDKLPKVLNEELTKLKSQIL